MNQDNNTSQASADAQTTANPRHRVAQRSVGAPKHHEAPHVELPTHRASYQAPQVTTVAAGERAVGRPAGPPTSYPEASGSITHRFETSERTASRSGGTSSSAKSSTTKDRGHVGQRGTAVHTQSSAGTAPSSDSPEAADTRASRGRADDSSRRSGSRSTAGNSGDQESNQTSVAGSGTDADRDFEERTARRRRRRAAVAGSESRPLAAAESRTREGQRDAASSDTTREDTREADDAPNASSDQHGDENGDQGRPRRRRRRRDRGADDSNTNAQVERSDDAEQDGEQPSSDSQRSSEDESSASSQGRSRRRNSGRKLGTFQSDADDSNTDPDADSGKGHAAAAVQVSPTSPFSAPEQTPAEAASAALAQNAPSVVLFKAPTAEAVAEAEAAAARRAQLAEDRRKAEAADEADDTDDDNHDNDDNDDSDDDSGNRRRRRRRGGRGRNKRKGEGDSNNEGSASDSSDKDRKSSRDDDKRASRHDGSSDSDADDDTDDNGSRRRRRRRRGSQGGSSNDEVATLKGSTRLEAKRQRRRAGRDSGKRRHVITESEFLARRESVERSMVVRESEGRTQVAVLEDGVLVEHYAARKAQTSLIGNVYVGRVQNVLPSMEAAFVDIGKGRNAVLYAGEVNWDEAGLGGKPRRIESALKSGDAVLVQVTKDAAGHKGPRLTSQISLPGRYLVYVPGQNMTGISRKLPDSERSRLKKILKSIVPADAGVIVRTAAEGASEDELRRDVERLQKQWTRIEKKRKSANPPSLMYREPDLAVKIIRDVFNEDFTSLTVSGDEAWATVSSYVEDLAPDLMERLVRWDLAEGDVFTNMRLDEQIAKALDRKVYLPSGGSLVIDKTEAMTVVDVNTGKFTGSGGNLEATVTKNNLEAAEEIVRQLRLRDLGGIIVVDFIDMVLESNRDLVLRRLLECLSRDRTKHQVAEVTSLGLVQMTRKRIGQGLAESFSEPCKTCDGQGYVLQDARGFASPLGRDTASDQSKDRSEARRAEQAAAVARVAAATKGKNPGHDSESSQESQEQTADDSKDGSQKGGRASSRAASTKGESSTEVHDTANQDAGSRSSTGSSTDETGTDDGPSDSDSSSGGRSGGGSEARRRTTRRRRRSSGTRSDGGADSTRDSS